VRAAAQRLQARVQKRAVHAKLRSAPRVRSLLGMPRARLIALPSLLLALALSACGGGPGSGQADPAGAVPAGASIYLEGVVRPDGSQKEDVLDAARKVLRTDDPERKLHELIDKGLAKSDSGDVTYDKDIAPWLGEKAGVWVAGAGRDKPGYVVVVATKDPEKAQEAIDKGARADGGKVRERSYGGVDYQLDQDGVAAGIVDDFFTVGTEAEFKRTVKAADGTSLAEDKQYQRTMDGLDGDRVGQFYLDLGPFFEQVLKDDPKTAGDVQQFRSIFPVDQLGPVGGALLADGDRIAVDTVTRGKGTDALEALGPLAWTGSTPLIGELPGDAWLALGSPDVGASVKTLFNRAAGAFGGAAATQQLKQRYGMDLERDVFGWIGDVAVYARGRTKADLEGAVVIEATKPADMQRAFGKLIGVFQQESGERLQPTGVQGADLAFKGRGKRAPVIARSKDRVVIGLGETAASDALLHGSKLADSGLYKQGKALLGDDAEPAFLLSMPDVIAAVEASGDADAHFARAKPYLDAFSVIVSGGSLQDDEARTRSAAGLK